MRVDWLPNEKLYHFMGWIRLVFVLNLIYTCRLFKEPVWEIFIMYRLFNSKEKSNSKDSDTLKILTEQTPTINEPTQPFEEDPLEEIFINSPREVKALAPRTNGLEALYDHFIKETNGDPIPFGKSEKIGLLLEILGGTGGIYAWPPAWEYGKNFAPWMAYSFAASNPASNTLFLINATDNLIDTIQAESNIPPEIKELINSPSKGSLIAKYLKMGLGSLVCVVPFSIAVYLFPLPNCDAAWCLGLTVSHSTLSSAILHGVSWGIILTEKYWYYRIPVLPFEKLYSLIKKSRTSAEELELLRLASEQQLIESKYKNQLVETLSKAVQSIVRGRSNAGLEESPLRTIQHESASFIEFVELAKRLRPELPPPSVQQSYFRRFVNKAHHMLSNGGVGILGAGIMIAGCMGWIANPIYIGFLEGLNLSESIGVGALPLYSTAVLCAFYGTGIFNQIYSYFTTWTGSLGDKVAPEIQMYPKTFALFTLVNIYISFFAFANGTQLIKTVFADEMWDDIRPALEGISIPTLQILSFIPLMDLFCLVVRKSQAKFGSLANDDTLAARLLVKMSLIVHYLQQMKGEELMHGINQYASNQQSALGIDPEQFETDFHTFFSLKKQHDDLSPPSIDVETPRQPLGYNRNSFHNSQVATSMGSMKPTTPLLQTTERGASYS
ncbi:hypothetical protein A8135_01840 [Legionella jamestowniensis]|uniref:Coiled-coil protein n=2 Tax=Legionella jamestowniensis TaxID=455 RepID=A0ABX2XTP9_9GAMM|nr:hypothetical protein A8135_01840 [Legionella jamestowniensis]